MLVRIYVERVLRLRDQAEDQYIFGMPPLHDRMPSFYYNIITRKERTVYVLRTNGVSVKYKMRGRKALEKRV